MRTLGWTKPTQTIRVGNVPCRGFKKAIDKPKAIDQAEPIADVQLKTNVEPIAKVNAVETVKPKRPAWLPF
jgi:hypothetical protein